MFGLDTIYESMKGMLWKPVKETAQDAAAEAVHETLAAGREETLDLARQVSLDTTREAVGEGTVDALKKLATQWLGFLTLTLYRTVLAAIGLGLFFVLLRMAWKLWIRGRQPRCAAAAEQGRGYAHDFQG